MQLKNKCTCNSKLHSASPRAITRLLLVQLFFSCTQISVITCTNKLNGDYLLIMFNYFYKDLVNNYAVAVVHVLE